MLELKDFSIQYGAVAAVNRINMRLTSGEITVVRGLYGAGKSSLLNGIIGKVPFSGSMKLDGKYIPRVRPAEMTRRGVSIMPEGGPVFLKMSLRENLNLILPKPASPFELDAAFEIFPSIRRYLDAPGYVLSGGQRQMLSFLRLVLARPRVLLLDEPTAGLAPDAVDAMAGKLKEIARSGATILVAEQASGLNHIADRVLEMSNGNLIHSDQLVDA